MGKFNPLNPKSKYWTKRRSKEKDGDYRTPWEHDYGRVVHSAAFRRLQAKTQVFGVGENDFYRTRLTHSLEVSQIGASLRNKLFREPKYFDEPNKKEKEEIKDWLPNAVLIRTICLAHDLGHPPFGHGGEVALNRCMLENNGFEGNGQALRIVTKLEKYIKDYGMDLTRRTVLGLIKYPNSFTELYNDEHYTGDKTNLSAKPIFKAEDFKPPKCYLDDEEDIINWVSERLGEWDKFKEFTKYDKEHSKTKHKSLDASIMEVADDIAYGVHDLEDCIAIGKIKKQELEEKNPQKWDFDEKDLKKWKIDERDLEQLWELIPEDISECPVDDLFSESYDRKKIIRAMVSYFIENTGIKVDSGFQHPLFKYRAILTEEAEKKLIIFKHIVKKIVIKNPEVQHLEFKGQKIVTELFHAFMTDPKRLLQPSDYRRIEIDKVETERVICDYIAGMTDEYAITRYQNLYEPRAGSIFDRL